MSSDDLTEKLPDTITTAPTIETLLNRINAFGEKLGGEIASIQTELAELRSGQDQLRTEMAELRSGQDQLRSDIKGGFHRVERKIEILNDNILTVQANHRDLLVRVEDLESKAS
jgi:chromosome segregation ATPase